MRFEDITRELKYARVPSVCTEEPECKHCLLVCLFQVKGDRSVKPGNCTWKANSTSLAVPSFLLFLPLPAVYLVVIG